MRFTRQSLVRSTGLRSTLVRSTLVRSTVVAGSVLAAAAVVATPAQAAPVLHGYANVVQGKCLDIRGGSTAEGAMLQEFSCKNASNQRFWTDDAAVGGTEIRVQSSFLCLEPTTPNAYSSIIQRQCSGADTQKWELVPQGVNAVTLKNKASGLCLQDYLSGDGSRREVTMWQCNGSAYQQWLLR